MSKIDDGGPAFPRQNDQIVAGEHDGMSLRDYFASKAPEPPTWWMRHVLNVQDLTDACGGMEYCEAVASWKYIHADAMIARRKAPPAITVKRVAI